MKIKIVYQRFTDTGEIAALFLLYNIRKENNEVNLKCDVFAIYINKGKYSLHKQSSYIHNYINPLHNYDEIYMPLEKTTNKDKHDIIKFTLSFR